MRSRCCNRICHGLKPLGIDLDDARNAALTHGQTGVISKKDSPVKILVIPTNEELLIARDLLDSSRFTPTHS